MTLDPTIAHAVADSDRYDSERIIAALVKERDEWKAKADRRESECNALEKANALVESERRALECQLSAAVARADFYDDALGQEATSHTETRRQLAEANEALRVEQGRHAMTEAARAASRKRFLELTDAIDASIPEYERRTDEGGPCDTLERIERAGEEIEALRSSLNDAILTARQRSSAMESQAKEIESLRAARARDGAGLVEIQRHRDAWRSYSYQRGARPRDFLDGNMLDEDRTPTWEDRAVAADQRVAELTERCEAMRAMLERAYYEIRSERDEFGWFDLGRIDGFIAELAIVIALSPPATKQDATGTPNMCDGCQRGLPVENGFHRGPAGPWNIQKCTRDRYGKDGPK